MSKILTLQISGVYTNIILHAFILTNGKIMSEYSQNILRLASDIVCSYVANNAVDYKELPELLMDVSKALMVAVAGEPRPSSTRQPEPATAPMTLTPAQIRKSITPDYIVCFENGRTYRSLTRHLRAAYNMSPAEYRMKWGLPPDYPMVAPNYAALRSQLARRIGLGSGKAGG